MRCLARPQVNLSEWLGLRPVLRFADSRCVRPAEMGDVVIVSPQGLGCGETIFLSVDQNVSRQVALAPSPGAQAMRGASLSRDDGSVSLKTRAATANTPAEAAEIFNHRDAESA